MGRFPSLSAEDGDEGNGLMSLCVRVFPAGRVNDVVVAFLHPVCRTSKNDSASRRLSPDSASDQSNSNILNSFHGNLMSFVQWM